MKDKIDMDEMRRMISAGKSARDICNRFDVTPATVSKACRAHDVPLPVRVYRQKPVGDGQRTNNSKPKADMPAPVTIPSDLPPRTASLIATGGRYRDLERWAEAWGRTLRQALAEWHGLRLPVSKGGAI